MLKIRILREHLKKNENGNSKSLYFVVFHNNDTLVKCNTCKWHSPITVRQDSTNE